MGNNSNPKADFLGDKIKPDHFYEIDLLRFLAILAVVFFHYTFRGSAADDMTVLAYPGLYRVTKYGYLGVELTFMISGFVILLTAFKKSPAAFAIARVVRLYPAFWACCSITFLATLAFRATRYTVSFKQYLMNMTMLNGFLGVDFVDGAYWILMVEILFYFWIFMILLLRQGKNIKYILGLWLCLGMVLSAHKVKYLNVVFLSDYISYFIAGGTFYLIYSEGLSFYNLFLMFASYLGSSMDASKMLMIRESHFQTPFSQNVVLLALASFYLFFFGVATRRTRNLAFKHFLWLGALTYPLYLLHQNIGFMIFNRLYSHINIHVLLWGTIAFMLCLSRFIHVHIELAWVKPLEGKLRTSLGLLSTLRGRLIPSRSKTNL
jgi:peptidoglycan/LPS O-acetylase OafA/YrhL